MASGYYDFSGAFGNLNPSPAGLGKQFDEDRKRQGLAGLGKKIQAGDLEGASQDAFALGDTTAGIGLLKLSQAAKQRADWIRENGGILGLGGGGSPQAAAPAPAAGYFANARSAESSGDDAAKNPNSTATGRYQFLRGTWDGLMRSNPELGLTADGRNDPQQQERAIRAFTAQNAEALRAKGIQPSDGNLYMAHFLGAGAAPNFISAVQQDPTVPAASLVTPQVARANTAVFFNRDGSPRSAGEVYQRMTARFGTGSTAVAALSGGDQPVQVAQAPGGPQADLPAQGAAPAQGFAIPGGDGAEQSLASNPRIQRLQRALANAPDEFKPSVQARLDLEIKDAERKLAQTEAVKNYRFYRQEEMQAGRQPMSFQAFRESTAPRSTIKMPEGEKEYDKQAAKDYAEMNRDLIKGGQAANQKIATLNRLEALLSDPNIRTGAGAQLALQAARLGKSVFGIETEGLGPAEAVNAIANQFALELRNPSGGAGMPGALSDKDREFLMQSTPGLERDPAGNKLIIDYMRRINQRSIDVERLRREYVKANKGRIDEGFFDKLAEFSEKNPLFPEAPPAQRGPVTVRSSADYDKLKSGDQFMDADGNLRTKR